MKHSKSFIQLLKKFSRCYNFQDYKILIEQYKILIKTKGEELQYMKTMEIFRSESFGLLY